MTLAASARRSTAAANGACVRRTCSSARAGARSPSRPTQTARSRSPGPACIDDGRLALVTIHAAPTASWVPHTRDVSVFQDGQGARRIGMRSAPGSAPATRASRRRLRFRPRHAHARQNRGDAIEGRGFGSEKLQMERVRVDDTGPAPRSVAVAAGEKGWSEVGIQGPSTPRESPNARSEFGTSSGQIVGLAGLSLGLWFL
ncbi:hypothetical protein OH76DRAFT_843313 [Lentinus brumalis]|uniref:Uncharacterized protein n=1 Tax=Lentinus brumalis TaxID=2498619 RepID=A0A371D1Z1_9APHY|nr:hypothetical protein OH76DRAFT_843313 [Polyporus brumalis]